MALKLMVEYYQFLGRFESDVISDGTQTRRKDQSSSDWFECDVIPDGT